MSDFLARVLPYAVPALMIGILLAIFANPWGSFAKYDQQLRLAKTGTPATARVIAVRSTHAMMDGNPIVNATLEVQGPQGPYSVQTEMVIPLVNIPSFQPGATVSVRIDPKRTDHIAVVFSEGVTP